jgi:AcrR family transcriptional regulator
MGPSKDTKSRILDLAAQLARHRGFNGFSYRDIAEPLEIRNAAVHYHFPTKADLGVALIRRYRDMLRTRTRHFMENGGDPAPQLEGLFSIYRRDSLNHSICPIGMVAVDYYTLPEAMLGEGKLLVAETISWLSRVLEVGREQGTLSFEGEPGARAVETLAALQGANQIGRLGKDDALELTIAGIRGGLGMSETAPAAG